MTHRSRHRQRAVSRREFLSYSAAGAVGLSASGWFRQLAAAGNEQTGRKKSCILLWMMGGPSQTDTFDPKPEHENGGEFKAIDTAISGVQFGEHLPQLAKVANDLTVIRSMQTKEGDHGRASFLMRTGQLPQGPIRYPSLGALLGKELNQTGNALPGYISVLPYRGLSPAAWGAGFLGPKHAPLIVGGDVAFGNRNYDESRLRVQNLKQPDSVTAAQARTRLELLNEMETEFLTERPDPLAEGHQSAYQRAIRMMRSRAMKAFELDSEPPELRDAYGRNYFGQGCLLARRLVERGVPFVEVSLNSASGSSTFGWDTHSNNFESVKQLCNVLDPGYATLINDLKTRGLLDDTLVIWMGEFGRTPKINGNSGRDHFPNAWSSVLAGGGTKGGQVIGSTGGDGMNVEENPVDVADLFATVCKGLDIDPHTQNMSNVGRPIRITELDAQPIEEVF